MQLTGVSPLFVTHHCILTHPWSVKGIHPDGELPFVSYHAGKLTMGWVTKYWIFKICSAKYLKFEIWRFKHWKFKNWHANHWKLKFWKVFLSRSARGCLRPCTERLSSIFDRLLQPRVKHYRYTTWKIPRTWIFLNF